METPENTSMRLAKTMAHRGICSRREADEYILKGWVMVNGTVVTQKGFQVSDTDEIDLNPKAVQQQEERVTIVLNKPVGFVSGQPEKNYKAAVSLIQPQHHWRKDASGIKFQRHHLIGLAPAGRLDIDSQGMLILTNDGRIARQLIGSETHIEKEYLVRVTGKIKPNGLELLQNGLSLDGEKLRPAKVSWQNEDQLQFRLKQGKKRQIRRMCALVGLKVIGLKRVRMGNIRLNDLPVGQWRYLSREEIF